MEKALGFVHLMNARQLGGYQTEDGHTVKENRLLRCAQLIEASAEERPKLSDVDHVETVIDLRTSRERDYAPDPVLAQADNIWLPILNENQKVDVDMEQIKAYTLEYGDNPAGEAVAIIRSGYDPSQMYREMLRDPYSRNQFHLFMDEVLKIKDDHAVLWHCSGGKDRAGTGAVLLLIALGVDEKTILDDFEMSNTYYADRIHLMLQAAAELTDDQKILKGTAAFAGVDRSYMEKALQWMKNEYGSPLQYLIQGLGIDKTSIQKLKKMYLD